MERKRMNYINNKSLLEEIRIYKESGVKTEELGGMLLLLARRYSDKGSFSGYSWRDDMICEAVLTCIKYLHRFDITKESPNPFAYFSRVIHNAFLSYIAKQKIHSKIKDLCCKNIDFIVPDINIEEDFSYFDLHGIDYQVIRGDKKRKRKTKKEND